MWRITYDLGNGETEIVGPQFDRLADAKAHLVGVIADLAKRYLVAAANEIVWAIQERAFIYLDAAQKVYKLKVGEKIVINRHFYVIEKVG